MQTHGPALYKGEHQRPIVAGIEAARAHGQPVVQLGIAMAATA